ncbi:trans-AT polyketide synthase/acyltransferase/oxidoreductase domain-containing protein [Paenibacillus shirakamiensis]|uniref:[acyl-carrier-protein] S-malonyltransferase n=1 Tax=Paenibacillus shirakamiensis TaxID=1265935 RepID=A0ABS4JEP6_9BACL|nr:ACP S-malonyltransferase [Paenibacillus shirakamiensis]MBP2000181.1 trans-AT polyketide synthase/acyltransferase/oxidoreductase domain-containing protein [Paenibacillus shirakamiensis]
MVCFVFPGQGSQFKGMGGSLFAEFPVFTQKANAILDYSIEELCLHDSLDQLQHTEFTQPALYVVNALHYMKKVQELGRKPDYTAGHSLGEYNALFAAGAFDFETGLKLVKMRGELMSRAKGGGMAAIIGLDEQGVRDVLIQYGFRSLDIANYNSPRQIVISGPLADVKLAITRFETVPGVSMAVLLKTSGAFHSRYMEAIAEEYEKYVFPIQVKPLDIPVISNVNARCYQPDEMHTNLVKQLTSPVKWTETIRYLMGLGEIEFVEVGAGKVLTGLIRRIQAESEPLIISEQGCDVDPRISHLSSSLSTSISISQLGSPQFKQDYSLKYPYIQSGMYYGISSSEMVVKMARAGMLGFLGVDGLDLREIRNEVRLIQSKLSPSETFGVNLVHHMSHPEKETDIIDLLLELNVKVIEVSSFLGITPAIAKFRARGLRRTASGEVVADHKIIAKISRPEIAEVFLSPIPHSLIQDMLAQRLLSSEEARLLQEIPSAEDICVESETGGSNLCSSPYALLPTILQLRDRMMEKYKYMRQIRIGAAGGIGSPDGVVAAFMLGADFIVTGSINQLTVEARISNTAKNLLQQANVQDFQYAPIGELFEIGIKAPVLKKGLLYPARANKLYDLYRTYNSIEEIDQHDRKMIEDKYFYQSFEEIYLKVKQSSHPLDVDKMERNPKQKMAEIFKWYLKHATQLALIGDANHSVDFQIRSSPALGAFNEWVKGSHLEDWRNRHVDVIGMKLMEASAKVLNSRVHALLVD